MKRGAKRAQSPCIDVCRHDPRTGWCLGCGRTAAEIGEWRKLTPFRRSRLEREFARRLAKLGKRTPSESLDGEFVGASATLGAGFETCDAAEDLATIGNPGMELVIWRRTLPPCLQTWLERMGAPCLPDIRVLVRPSDLRRAVEPHLDRCGMPPGDMRDLLLGDVDDLVSAFARIARSDLVDVRLERVSHDACWKFHRDCVEARLLTTYRGPATEWVRPIDADRALREQRSYDGPLERLRVHDVAIFKGSCAGPGSGIVHRSPPIAGTGRTRLLLCLNKRSAASPKPWPKCLEHEAPLS